MDKTNELDRPYTTSDLGQSVGSRQPMSRTGDRGVEVNQSEKLNFRYPQFTPQLRPEAQLDLIPASEILSLANLLLSTPIMARH